MTDSLLIVGATARAAADSAVRAGLRPLAADCFRDWDLVRSAPAVQVPRYPHGLLRAVSALPATRWIYTGALENYPLLLIELARQQRLAGSRLLGNGPQVVRQIRDPQQLDALAAEQGWPRPERRNCSDRPPLDGDSWLWKPTRSAAGIGIRAGSRCNRAAPRNRGYWQRQVSGVPMGAVYVGRGGAARLLGVSRTLSGAGWCGARGFQYAGSIGPIDLPAPLVRQLEQMGNVLADRFALIGLFNIDGIASARGFELLEVNPRYSASVEVLEHSLGIQALRLHCDACEGVDDTAPSACTLATGTEAIFGKAVVYTQWPVRVGERLAGWAMRLAGRRVADVPWPGAAVAARRPLLTVLASGATMDDVERKLRRRSHLAWRLAVGGD